MVPMVPLGVPVSLQQTAYARITNSASSPMTASRAFSRRPPLMETHQEEDNDEVSSGYSSSHAHFFRSYHDLTTCSERPLRTQVWENHHSC
ncbi:hypothetical protein Hamer_G013544 [Homarus americanus]|uniref:Uncharacterized protein n=1 Tax=Homarus americanus TaxID=6706 RepID=A0A8J5K7C9_HOMAM|nr:hypothetical protein Hamer_G013544 [Homarus americanus]